MGVYEREMFVDRRVFIGDPKTLKEKCCFDLTTLNNDGKSVVGPFPSPESSRVQRTVTGRLKPSGEVG